MSTVRNLRVAAVSAAFGATALIAGVSNATTVQYSLNEANIGCGTPPCAGSYGTVSVTGNDGTGALSFIVTLASGYDFVNGADAFAFSLGRGSPLAAITPLTFTIPSGSPISNPTDGGSQSAGATSMDGFGKFLFTVDLTGSGGGGPLVNTLSFSVTNAANDLVLSDIVQDLKANGTGLGTGGYLFAADFCPTTGCANGNTGFTAGGPILGGGGQNEVPLPAALPMFASVLGGGIVFTRWRRKRQAA